VIRVSYIADVDSRADLLIELRPDDGSNSSQSARLNR